MNQPFDLTVMMYHYIRDPGDEAEAGSGIPGLSVHEFESQLDTLSRAYTIVTWPEVCSSLSKGKPLPGSACLLTFDDGVRDHYFNVFRILHARKLSGLFFVLDRSNMQGLVLAHKIHFLLAALGLPGLFDVVWENLTTSQRDLYREAERRYQLFYPPTSTDNRINLLKAVLQRDLSAEIDMLLSDLFEEHIGPESEIAKGYYLTLEQIREMSAGGMHFGGHSRRHPWFDWIDARERDTEIRASCEWLGQIELGPWAFAYPYGGLSEDSSDLLKKHGFIAAFTTRKQLQHTDPYYIGRLDGEEMVQKGGLYA